MPQLTNIELEQLNLTLGGALLLLCALYCFASSTGTRSPVSNFAWG
jgi:hypothetical protein